jgi:1-acyl-sn-glycerol-3-phosphate acyltransferase
MKLTLRLLVKCTWVVLLFVAGILLAGIVFPAISYGFAKKAKHYRDAIKMRWLHWFSRILGCRINLEGVIPEQGTMLVCNHISWIDIIVVGRFLPAYFVAKSDILSWPVIGFLAQQAGTIFIRRGDKKHIHATSEKMLWLLKQNSNIIVFPEGTTTCGDEVLHFHASLFQPAVITKAWVQPVAISYQYVAKSQAPFVGDDEFIPHLFKMLSLDGIDVTIKFLKPISASGKSRVAISDEARQAICAEINDGDWSKAPITQVR